MTAGSVDCEPGFEEAKGDASRRPLLPRNAGTRYGLMLARDPAPAAVGLDVFKPFPPNGENSAEIVVLKTPMLAAAPDRTRSSYVLEPAPLTGNTHVGDSPASSPGAWISPTKIGERAPL